MNVVERIERTVVTDTMREEGKMMDEANSFVMTIEAGDELVEYHITGKKMLFSGSNKTMIVGGTAFDFANLDCMYTFIYYAMANGFQRLPKEGLEVRPATEFDLKDAVSFQESLRSRIQEWTREDPYIISQFEDYYLCEFFDAIRFNRSLTDDVDTLVSLAVGEMGYPEWFDLFDSIDQIFETMTILVKKVKDW